MAPPSEENPLEGFRIHIAKTLQHVLQSLSIDLPAEFRDDAVALAAQFEKGKLPEYTFSLPLPKVKIPGNAVQVAETVAAKVPIYH